MAINTSQVISLIIVLAIFAIIIYTISKVFKQTCDSGEVFDPKINNCRPNCEDKPYTKWDYITSKCVSVCDEPKKSCGSAGCYDPATQQCANNNKLCDINNSLCYSKSNTFIDCYNPKTEACVPDKNQIVPKTQVCLDGTTICKLGEKCSENNKCIKCDHELCGDICCDKNKYCNKDTKQCTDCENGGTLCNGVCCNPNTQQCVNNKCVNCSPDKKYCSDTGDCCEQNQVCTPSGCCDSTKVDKKGICCKNGELDSNGICCEYNSTDGSRKVINGQCVLVCGDQYCDPNTQKCFTDNNKSVCKTTGCDWKSDIDYTPQQMKDKNNKPINVVEANINGVTNLYMVQNPRGLSNPETKLSKIGIATQSPDAKANCTGDDCYARILQDDMEFLSYDPNAKKCVGKFDLAKLPTIDNWVCPFDNDPKRCCATIDQNGNTVLSGQVCPEFTECDNGICHTKCDSTEVWNNTLNKCIKKDLIKLDTMIGQQSDGSGHNNQLDYLNRFNWKCPEGSVLSRFKLNITPRNGWFVTQRGDLNYEYDCKKTAENTIASDSNPYRTSMTDFGSGSNCDHCRKNMAKLTPVVCPDGKGLVNWHWEQDPNSGSAGYSDMGRSISYNCTNVPFSGKCREIQTNTTKFYMEEDFETTNKSVYPLSEHNIGEQCGPNEYLKGFKYNEDQYNNTSYTYTCCEYKPDQTLQEALTQAVAKNFSANYAGVL